MSTGNMRGRISVRPIDIYLEPAIDAGRMAATDKAQDIADNNLGQGTNDLYDNFTQDEIDEITKAFEEGLERYF